MRFLPDPRILIEIGPFSITFYALFIVSGALLAYYLAKRECHKYAYPDRFIDDLFIYCLVFGFIGARLWYCIFYDFNYYFSNPFEILKIYEGGLAIQGGVLSGFLFAFIYALYYKINILRLGDAILPNVLIAQSIGRWGNFINKEAHGAMVSESFFKGPLAFLKDGMYIDGVYYEPTFFYESILNLIGFILINFGIKKVTKKRGKAFFAYFIWYGIVRFFIEFKRTDALKVGSSNLLIAQIISILFVIIGIIGFIGLFDKFIPSYKPTIIFDLDGTLIDSKISILKTYEYLFTKYRKAKDFNEAVKKEVIGPSLKEMFSKYFPEHNYQDLLQEYRNLNEKHFADFASPIDNAYYVLKTLKDNNYKVFIFSTKMHKVIEDNLKTFNLANFVDDIVGIDDTKNPKPDAEGIYKLLTKYRLSFDEIIMIGDTYLDIRAGKKAKAFTIACNFEEDSIEMILKEKPNIYIKDLSEILIILEKNTYFNADNI